MNVEHRERVVVIYSGGMDSYTLLKQCLRDALVHALSFHYGQRHSKELNFAREVCEEDNIPHQIIDIRSIHQLISGSALTDNISVPEGHYEEDSMKATVVPNRNMIMLSLAVAHAVSIDASAVYFGAHGGDHAIYPDCRPEFVKRMNAVSEIANYQPVAIRAPFLQLSKAEILAMGLDLGLDYSQTWTCYNGLEYACGRCGSCHERLEAFQENGVSDPIRYAGA